MNGFVTRIHWTGVMAMLLWVDIFWNRKWTLECSSHLTVITIPGSDDCISAKPYELICHSSMSKSNFGDLLSGYQSKVIVSLVNVSAYQAGQHLHFNLYRASIINIAFKEDAVPSFVCSLIQLRGGPDGVANSRNNIHNLYRRLIHCLRVLTVFQLIEIWKWPLKGFYIF